MHKKNVHTSETEKDNDAVQVNVQFEQSLKYLKQKLKSLIYAEKKKKNVLSQTVQFFLLSCIEDWTISYSLSVEISKSLQPLTALFELNLKKDFTELSRITIINTETEFKFQLMLTL